jgi:replicative DNA helicase
VIPPNYFQSIEKEQALLGSILTHNDILDDHKVDARLFSTETHRRIFAEIEKAIARGASGNIMEVGLMLPDIIVEVAELSNYQTQSIAAVINDLEACHKARGVSKMLRTIESMQNDGGSVLDTLEEASRQILGLSESRTVTYRALLAVAKDTIEAISRRAQNKNECSGIESGIPRLDGMTDGFQDGDYIVIGARPSVGKTAFALSIAMSAAKKGKSVGFLSLEMSDVALLTRYMAGMSGIPLNCLRKGLLSPRMHADLMNTARDMQTQKLYLGDSPNMSIGDLISEARILKKRERIDILLVDYLGLITMRSKAPRWEAFSEISQRLKSLARELGIPLVVLAQIRREAQDKRPTLADLRETGSIEQDADVICFLHREGQPSQDGRDKIELILAKQRNGEVGTVPLWFDKPKMRFYEMDTREERKP